MSILFLHSFSLFLLMKYRRIGTGWLWKKGEKYFLDLEVDSNQHQKRRDFFDSVPVTLATLSHFTKRIF